MVHQDQVGDADLSEVDAERVDPEPVRIAGIASGDVAGDAFVVSEPGEQAKRGSQALLAVAALLGYGAERWAVPEHSWLFRALPSSCNLLLGDDISSARPWSNFRQFPGAAGLVGQKL